jgi:hypothetical protein
MQVGRWTKQIEYGEGSATPGFPPIPAWFEQSRFWGD